ncbi:MAG TPA: tetratricopeptide repeat protein, partial [Candidatus Baltobacteraceae bacterium]|nr:tetratricopeptide repeat protein [Candidatus Baltobacteraceae bacterium]
MIPEELAAAAEAQRASDYFRLEKIARDLIASSTDAGDFATLGNAYAYLGAALVGFNDGPGARAAFTRSQGYLERIGDEMGVVRALNGLAVAAMDLDLDASTARSYIDVALPVARRAIGGERLWLGVLLGNRSEVERFDGDYRTAIASAREALRILNELHEKARAGWQLTNIA